MQAARPAFQFGTTVKAGRRAADRLFVDALDEGCVAACAGPDDQARRQSAPN
jgi:hypothetical protein